MNEKCTTSKNAKIKGAKIIPQHPLPKLRFFLQYTTKYVTFWQ